LNWNVFSIVCYRCISADVPDSFLIGSGTYKMCTVQKSSLPQCDLTKGGVLSLNNLRSTRANHTYNLRNILLPTRFVGKCDPNGGDTHALLKHFQSINPCSNKHNTIRYVFLNTNYFNIRVKRPYLYIVHTFDNAR